MVRRMRVFVFLTDRGRAAGRADLVNSGEVNYLALTVDSSEASPSQISLRDEKQGGAHATS